jgi:glycosyltransferase involved in cell wall biosynthesis
MKNSIKIITPFYNAKNFIKKSLTNSLNQNYDNFKVILINDASTDDSEETYLDLLELYKDKLIYIKNNNRMGAMFNHQNAVLNYCDENDIVVQVDGDDWLIDSNVLTYINDFYNKHKCMVMYGQAKYLSGRNGNACPYENETVFLNKRNYFKFHVSHVRTFFAKLFHEIKNQDNTLSCFKNNNGDWYQMTCDVAMMYPLMEICGYEKVKYNDKVLYIYNDSNPIQDYKIDLTLQENIHKEILNKPVFKLKNYE